MENKFDRSQKIVLLMIIFGVLCRIIPHPPNFSPITAIALFGGHNLSDRRVAFSLPLVILFFSDLFLGIFPISLFVYAGFLTIVYLGTKIKSIGFGNIILSSLIFFIISNFGVWILGYPRNIDGLIQCYTLAIPFFGYSIAGDLFFGYLFKFSFIKISSIFPKSIN
tara:strand:- start:982 stop:1479 length:498 start_codon:yes stop_codon:yes gene_type:complete